jgi:hypothetical protein
VLCSKSIVVLQTPLPSISMKILNHDSFIIVFFEILGFST